MQTRRWIALSTMFLFLMTAAGEADAARKKRKRRKRRKPAVTKVVVEPQPAESSAGVSEEASSDASNTAASTTFPVQKNAADPTAVAKTAEEGPATAAQGPSSPASSAASPAPAAPPSGAPASTSVNVVVAAPAAVTTAEPPSVESESAAEPERPAEEAGRPTFSAGLLVAGLLPQVVSKLGTSFVVSVEGAYLLPVADRRLGITLDVGYSRPTRDVGADDVRLAGGSYDVTVTDEELMTGLGLVYRIWPPEAWLNVYGRAAGVLHLQRSSVDGDSDGTALGVNEEQKTAFGGLAAAGAELLLGPGAASAELAFSFADLNHEITGNASTGGLALRLGYRFLF